MEQRKSRNSFSCLSLKSKETLPQNLWNISPSSLIGPNLVIHPFLKMWQKEWGELQTNEGHPSAEHEVTAPGAPDCGRWITEQNNQGSVEKKGIMGAGEGL